VRWAAVAAAAVDPEARSSRVRDDRWLRVLERSVRNSEIVGFASLASIARQSGLSEGHLGTVLHCLQGREKGALQDLAGHFPILQMQLCCEGQVGLVRQGRQGEGYPWTGTEAWVGQHQLEG
jgi:hypothetical protein